MLPLQEFHPFLKVFSPLKKKNLNEKYSIEEVYSSHYMFKLYF